MRRNAQVGRSNDSHSVNMTSNSTKFMEIAAERMHNESPKWNQQKFRENKDGDTASDPTDTT